MTANKLTKSKELKANDWKQLTERKAMRASTYLSTEIKLR